VEPRGWRCSEIIGDSVERKKDKLASVAPNKHRYLPVLLLRRGKSRLDSQTQVHYTTNLTYGTASSIISSCQGL
jgi:hypothetical protein